MLVFMRPIAALVVLVVCEATNSVPKGWSQSKPPNKSGVRQPSGELKKDETMPFDIWRFKGGDYLLADCADDSFDVYKVLLHVRIQPAITLPNGKIGVLEKPPAKSSDIFPEGASPTMQRLNRDTCLEIQRIATNLKSKKLALETIKKDVGDHAGPTTHTLTRRETDYLEVYALMRLK